MGPTDHPMFTEQCVHCGAFDTEIRFKPDCPAAGKVEITGEVERIELRASASQTPAQRYAQQVAIIQSNWFANFGLRQIMRAGGYL